MNPLSKEQSPTFKENLPSQPTDIPLEGVLLLRNTDNRAVDRAGRTVDFRLSTHRDVGAAKAFFLKAIKGQGCAPKTITLDGYAASHRSVRELSRCERATKFQD